MAIGVADGLIGDTIPQEARIITVVDAFNAMRSKRPYRDGLARPGAGGAPPLCREAIRPGREPPRSRHSCAAAGSNQLQPADSRSWADTSGARVVGSSPRWGGHPVWRRERLHAARAWWAPRRGGAGTGPAPRALTRSEPARGWRPRTRARVGARCLSLRASAARPGRPPQVRSAVRRAALSGSARAPRGCVARRRTRPGRARRAESARRHGASGPGAGAWGGRRLRVASNSG